MKARIARGIALALAGCWFTANAHAQYTLEGPYSPASAAYNQGVYGAGVETPSPAEPSLLSEGPEQQAQQAPPVPVPEKDQESPWKDYSTEGSSGCADGTCDMGGMCGLGGCGCCGNWFGGVYGLIMDRDDENNLWLSYDNEANQSRLLSSQDADMDWSGGFEARVGRYFNGCNNALEVVYWGIFADTSEANAYAADSNGELLSALRFEALTYDFGAGPQPVFSLYDNAQRHRLTRSNEFHNIEINLLGRCMQPCSNLRLGWAAGVRYFRFDEGFQYSTDPTDTQFTGAPEELHYTIDCLNQLVGAQIGGRADWYCWHGLNLYADAKVGVYNNHIQYHQTIAGDFGPAVIDDPGTPYDGQYVEMCDSKDDVSILAELNLGTSYCVTRCFSITGGYRAVAVSGVALTTNQVPVDFIANLDSLGAVDSNGDLILHGAYAGVNFNY
jgi:hypothetical protein